MVPNSSKVLVEAGATESPEKTAAWMFCVCPVPGVDRSRQKGASTERSAGAQRKSCLKMIL